MAPPTAIATIRRAIERRYGPRRPLSRISSQEHRRGRVRTQTDARLPRHESPEGSNALSEGTCRHISTKPEAKAATHNREPDAARKRRYAWVSDVHDNGVLRCTFGAAFGSRTATYGDVARARSRSSWPPILCAARSHVSIVNCRMSSASTAMSCERPRCAAGSVDDRSARLLRRQFRAARQSVRLPSADHPTWPSSCRLRRADRGRQPRRDLALASRRAGSSNPISS